ncbi:MAG: UDP-2,3-diacylglucosamine diphosphatase LpxI [Leptospiraceae bacterium]|nr:UDP-2,3-diacylglucosamine diphosphatase LpxI [Leptospiraceae bacterium]MDW8307646.1 UDP-2,3-diacylglucosamine diphosphatase LpxI [Leptospiraceae bacterium]
MVLGIVAGGGLLPLLCAREAQRKNIPLKIFLYQEETQELADKYRQEFPEQCVVVRLGRLGELFSAFKKYRVSDVIFLGKIHKERLFSGMKYDLKALTFLAKMSGFSDQEFFDLLLRELNRRKIKVLPQYTFLQSLLLREGVYTKRKLTNQDWEDIRYGLFYARKMGELDIGQTVVVRRKTVLAVEALEGTDACILRGGALSHGKGAVVCKAERHSQDPRFDIPTVGLHTLQKMAESSCHILAVESHSVFVIGLEEMVSFANSHNIAIVSHKPVLKKP